MKRIILATAAAAAISSRYTTAATTNNQNNNGGYNSDVTYGTYNQKESWKRRHQESRKERRRRRTQRQHSTDTPPSSDPPLFSSNTSQQQLSKEEEYNKMKQQYELQLSKEEYEESYLRDDGEAQHLNEPHWSETQKESEEHSKTEEMLLQQMSGGEEGEVINVNEVSFTSSTTLDDDDKFESQGHESVGPGKIQSTDDDNTDDDGMVQISTAANTADDDDNNNSSNNGATEEEETNEEEEEDNFNNALMVGIDSEIHPEKQKMGKSTKKGKSSKGGGNHNNQGSTGGKGNGWHSNGLLEEIEAQVEEAENEQYNGGHGQTSESNNMNGSSNMEEGVHAVATGKSGKGTKPTNGSSWNTSAKPTSTQGGHQGDDTTQDEETDKWSKPYTIFDPKTSKLFKTSTKSHKSTKKGNWWSPSWPSPPTPQTTHSPTPNNTTSTSYPTMTPTLSNDEYPPLTWVGVEGCTIDSPCPACSGDCDESSDCLTGLECYKRTNSDDVPGCTSGGVGDIPGADYCYDPSLVGNTTTAPSIASFPTYSPVEQPSPTPPPQEPSIPVPLTWVGVNGCTPTQPCGACFGDCDANTDCQSADGSGIMACFKRADGDTSQVPGCLTGGDGDIPGADYCYVVSNSAPSPPSPSVGDLPTPQFTTSSTPSPQDDGVDAYFIRSQARGSSSNSFSTQDIAVMRSDPPKTRYLKTKNLQAFVPNRPGLNSGYSRPDQNFTFGDGNEASGPQEEEDESSQGYQDQVYQDPTPTMYQEGDEPSDQVYQVYQGSSGGDSSSSGDNGWCISGALSPNYYQLLLEECIPDSLTSPSSSSRLLQRTGGSTTSNTVVARMEQMDQLWSMDTSGYIHSIYDYDRCMMVPSSSIPADTRSVNEVPVEIGPCNDVNALNQFYYDSSSSIPNVLKLQGYDTLCVTFLGGDMATKGSQMILDQCESQDKFGWDFVHEDELDSSLPPPPQPSPPSSQLPELRYLGRDGCNEQSKCPACSGDCDTDADCQTGLKCYERDRDTSPQVPGCGVGGPGDIAGADYCYDQSNDGSSSPPPPSPSSQVPQPLNWIGVGGCTVDNPCPACSGDCDSDLDCQGSCYKRAIGESTPIPGCAVGGMGDIPGGDYCYDSSSSESINPGESRPAVQPIPPSPTPDNEPSNPSSNNSESSESGYPTLSPTVLPDESNAPTGSRSTGSLPVSQGTSDTTGTQTVSTPTHTSSNSSGVSTTPSYPGTKSSKAALEPISSSVVSNERVREHASTKAEREQEIEELEEEIKELQEEDEAEEIEDFFLNQKRGRVSTHAEREKDNK